MPAAGLLQDVGSKAEGRLGDSSWGRRCRSWTDLHRVRSHCALCDLALLKVLMQPDGVVEARGTQDVVAALRSGGEEQCIAATERPVPGAGRGQCSVVGAGSKDGLSLRGKDCFGEGKGSGGGRELGLEQGSMPEEALWRACRI